MRAGPLRHLAWVQRVTQARTDAGGYTESWANLARAWVSISPIRGAEFLNAEAMNSDITHKVVSRDIPGYTFTPRDRISARSRVFNIMSVANVDERDRMLEFMCKEVV